MIKKKKRVPPKSSQFINDYTGLVNHATAFRTYTQ